MDFQLRGIEQIGMMADYWDAWFLVRPQTLTMEAVVEDARLRLEDDTSSPSGKPWDPWSEGYAATRGPGDKLLYSSGDLAESLAFQRTGSSYEMGSDLDYALVHQEGSLDGTTEARPYVGLNSTLRSALDGIYAADFDKGWR